MSKSIKLTMPAEMRAELEEAERSTGFSASDLIRHFTAAGLDAIRAGEGVTAKARWGKAASPSEAPGEVAGVGGP